MSAIVIPGAFLVITVSPLPAIIFTGAIMVIAGLLAFFMGFSDWRQEKRFFRHAVLTKGTVIGTIASMQSAVGYASVKNTGVAGFFLYVEYEAGGSVYTLRSQQSFNEHPANDEIDVYYLPDNPGEAVVGRYYLGNEKYFQMAGGAFLIALPFAYYLLSF